MDFGDMMMAVGAVKAERNNTQAAINNGLRAIDNVGKHAVEVINEVGAAKNAEISRRTKAAWDFAYSAWAHIHALRAKSEAHVKVEAELARIIAEHDPTNPLASVENIEKLVNSKFAKNIEDPEIIKRTYPDGEIIKKEKYFDELLTLLKRPGPAA